VLAANNGTAEVETSDGGRLVIKLTSGSELIPGQVYQFLGRAESASEFVEISSLQLGTVST